MRYIIYGKNLEVTEGLKQAVHDSSVSWRSSSHQRQKFRSH